MAYNFDIIYNSLFAGEESTVLTIVDKQNGTISATLQAETTLQEPENVGLTAIRTVSPVRWDTLSKDFFGSYEYVGLIISANKHLPTASKTSLYAPANATIIIPEIVDKVAIAPEYIPEWRI